VNNTKPLEAGIVEIKKFFRYREEFCGQCCHETFTCRVVDSPTQVLEGRIWWRKVFSLQGCWSEGASWNRGTGASV